ncbi:MAG: hypothetical protein US89_C0015G0027 [Candidatus Peregrinibacteria bacterium GW2011_GWF2_38_29]|nr:MAG: hypothetical protein US89_C0015G0027 [Candidatus Peregrinibacteria bacterium GW2011_GWF2_38_29]HBB02713.1 hypothetical protein [Candidatus Peregrinibacteria bacterium]
MEAITGLQIFDRTPASELPTGILLQATKRVLLMGRYDESLYLTTGTTFRVWKEGSKILLRTSIETGIEACIDPGTLITCREMPDIAGDMSLLQLGESERKDPEAVAKLLGLLGLTSFQISQVLGKVADVGLRSGSSVENALSVQFGAERVPRDETDLSRWGGADQRMQ